MLDNYRDLSYCLFDSRLRVGIGIEEGVFAVGPCSCSIKMKGMIVEVLRGSVGFPLVGEYYMARSYSYDSSKVTLVYQVDPVTLDKLVDQHYPCSDIDPLVNEYRCNLRVVRD